jgi:LPXTG-site transpeptidase (sortase) family protein
LSFPLPRGRWWLGAAVLAILPALGTLGVVMERATPQVPPAPNYQASSAGEGSVLGGAANEAVLGASTPSPRGIPVRLVIGGIGVDAPLTAKGVDENGDMEAPNGPEDVAWYDFSARPGEGGNMVLSGHVDYRGYGPAVLARLDELESGDVVELHSADGAVFRYGVVVTVSYDAENAPVEQIIGPTARETVTLITCDGRFDQATGQYSHRLIVRAERLPEEPETR